MVQFRANGSHPARPADADTRAFWRKVLGVVVVLVGRQSLSAAEAVAVGQHERLSIGWPRAQRKTAC
jgi:hypothetical protein